MTQLPSATPELVWQLSSTTTGATVTWQAGVLPGLTLLQDASGEASHHWLAALSTSNRLRLQPPGPLLTIFWRNPREPLSAPEMTAQQWLDSLQPQWPTWDTDAWQRHVQGFALSAQLQKPLWHLSTGSLRKLWMAAALASGATVTVIDEPCAGLDASSIRYLCQALQALGEQIQQEQLARWVLLAHWEMLPGVIWDEVLEMPALPA